MTVAEQLILGLQEKVATADKKVSARLDTWAEKVAPHLAGMPEEARVIAEYVKGQLTDTVRALGRDVHERQSAAKKANQVNASESHRVRRHGRWEQGILNFYVRMGDWYHGPICCGPK